MKSESSHSGQLYRLAAFSSDPKGGNPAGVWLGEHLPQPEIMQKIANEVGYSETAFITPTKGLEKIVRYYSPEAEVSFCGHATIASGVVLGSQYGAGTYSFATAVGAVPVEVKTGNKTITATLTSVTPAQTPVTDEVLSEALSLLSWTCDDLDSSIPPIKAYAGAWHLVIALKSSTTLDKLKYDFEGMKELMLREELTTLQLVWRESDKIFHSRNPFPVGGVIEDPATGAAAAAFGGYLRDAKLLATPCAITLFQGEAMGRPSTIEVSLPSTGGIEVTGSAVPI